MDYDRNEIAAAVEAGRQAADIKERISIHEGIPFAVVSNTMKVESLAWLLDEAEKRAGAPRAFKGTAHHLTLESFINHANRFKLPCSALWASPDAQEGPRLTALYDYPAGPAEPRWMQHRAVYTCPLSDEWKAWMENSGEPLGQEAFADWIDSHLEDLAAAKDYPTPAAVLELARNLAIHAKGTFERKINPTTGEGILVVKDEHEPTSTKIPRAFLLKLPVFVGGALYAVEARIRFLMSNGHPVFSYALHRVGVILRDAFDEVVKKAVEGTGLKVFYGSPER